MFFMASFTMFHHETGHRQGVKAPGNSTDLHGLPKECGRWHLHAMGDLQDPKMGATLVAFFRILGHLLGYSLKFSPKK